MLSPFPGMDPWLEQPGVWSDLHTTLITALREELTRHLRPHYYVGIDQRTYITPLDEDDKVIGRPDVYVVKSPYLITALPPKTALSPVLVAEPVVADLEHYEQEEVVERYLEVRKPRSGEVVTVIEILSPKNKRSGERRLSYLQKRRQIIRSQTHLVEIDLLRAGKPMPFVWRDKEIKSHYRILVSRSNQRPQIELYPFTIREPIPRFKLPLLPNDSEPIVELSKLLHSLYERAGYDLVIDYTSKPTPRLSGKDADWVDNLLKERGRR